MKRSNLSNGSVDFIVAFKEWIPGSHLQMRVFEKRVGHEFLLVAPGHPDIQAKLSQGNGTFQAFAVKIADGDRNKIVTGADYALQPVNTNPDYIWQLAPDLQPIRLKD